MPRLLVGVSGAIPVSRQDVHKIFINNHFFINKLWTRWNIPFARKNSIFCITMTSFTLVSDERKWWIQKKVYKRWKRSIKGFLSFSLFYVMLTWILLTRINKFIPIIENRRKRFFIFRVTIRFDYFAHRNYTT